MIVNKRSNLCSSPLGHSPAFQIHKDRRSLAQYKLSASHWLKQLDSRNHQNTAHCKLGYLIHILSQTVQGDRVASHLPRHERKKRRKRWRRRRRRRRSQWVSEWVSEWVRNKAGERCKKSDMRVYMKETVRMKRWCPLAGKNYNENDETFIENLLVYRDMHWKS